MTLKQDLGLKFLTDALMSKVNVAKYYNKEIKRVNVES